MSHRPGAASAVLRDSILDAWRDTTDTAEAIGTRLGTNKNVVIGVVQRARKAGDPRAVFRGNQIVAAQVRKNSIPAERIDAVLRLWGENRSTGEIAARLGLTKDEVSGCLRSAREKGDPRAVRREEAAPRFVAPRPAPVVARPALGPMAYLRPVAVEPRKETTREEAVTRWGHDQPLHYPREMRCQWIEGDHRAGGLWCGAERAQGRAYCPAHTARAFVRPQTEAA